jgi:Cu-Zn family superoxide dismutase
MKKLVSFSITLLILGACATAMRPTASATLAPTSGQTASGTVTFMQNADGSVTVDVKLSGVPPGTHGFHVHDKGDCGDNGNAAGGHFNPTNAPHGAPGDASRHAGDFGNVEADASGNVNESRTLHGITVESGATSVVGHAVILHANPDDLKTQPTGNAGGRIACGVVQMQ